MLISFQAPKKGGSKPKKATEAPKKVKASDPLFPARPRTFQVGGDIRPAGRDLKVPPAVNQFTTTIGKNEAMTVFTLFNKYRPDTTAIKKQRIKEAAAGNETPKKQYQVKFGLKHVTTLVEEKKAQLVLIANDVDPVELVMWLPALCRKMQVPYMIVKDKARLGALVHQKTAAVVALTGVDKADEAQLNLLKNLAKEKYNDNPEAIRKWGGGKMGLKTQAKLDKRAKAMAVEEAKKLASVGRA
jgi:large subunit ribosomal protein L7Ae